MSTTRKNRKAKAKKKANKKINEANYKRKNHLKMKDIKIEVTKVTKDNLEDVLNVLVPSTSHYIEITDSLIEIWSKKFSYFTKDELIEFKNQGFMYDPKKDVLIPPTQDVEFYSNDID